MSSDRSFNQYMAQLKVNLLEAHQTRVTKSWGEKNSKPDYAKLYLILDGTGFITINDVTYHPVKGDIIYIPEGCHLTFGINSRRHYLKYWCHFNAHIGTTPLSEIIEFPYLLHLEDTSDLEATFTELSEAFQSSDRFAPIIANSYLMKLIHQFLKEVPRDQIHLRQQAASLKINQLLDFMALSIDKKLTIDDLVEVANLHPNYLIRYFKSSFGTSPIAYFNRLKIEKAKELLSIRNESIKNIAASLGYSSSYYFSSAFKKQTGFTPSDYRKRYHLHDR